MDQVVRGVDAVKAGVETARVEQVTVATSTPSGGSYSLGSRTSARTLWPAARSAVTRWLPTNPVAPVTSACIATAERNVVTGV